LSAQNIHVLGYFQAGNCFPKLGNRFAIFEKTDGFSIILNDLSNSLTLSFEASETEGRLFENV
jgi:hypothetical protein